MLSITESVQPVISQVGIYYLMLSNESVQPVISQVGIYYLMLSIT